MTDSADRLAKLSPEKRALALKLLKEREQAAARNDAGPRAGSVRDGDSAPLSVQQRQMRIAEALGKGASAYHVQEKLHLRGGIDVEALALAVDRTVARHEALRTVFVEGEHGQTRQLVRPAPRAILRRIALDALPRFLRDREARVALKEELRFPFDAESDIPFRALLVTIVPGEEAYLAFTLHHLAVDGWSMGLVLSTFAEAYANAKEGRTDLEMERPAPASEDAALRYVDYALWQNGPVVGKRIAEQVARAVRRLSGVGAFLALPFDGADATHVDTRGARIARPLPAALGGRIDAFARERRTTPFFVTLAAFEALLASWSGQRSFAIGTPVANRSLALLEAVVGLFVNTLALRAEIGASATLVDVLESVQRDGLAALSDMEAPLDDVVVALAPERDGERPVLVQTLFAYQNMPMVPISLPGLAAELLPNDDDTSKLELSLTVLDRGAGPEVEVEFAESIFARATMEDFLSSYVEILTALTEKPDARIDEAFASTTLALRAASEQPAAGLEELRRLAAANPPRTETLDGLFESQAARTPDAIAVRWDGGEVTYADLERDAARIAECVWGRVGVEYEALGETKANPSADRLVGVCLERSPTLIAALLGVLRAQCAYVPLDPHYAEQRVANMITDARLRLIVTRRAFAARFAGMAAELLFVEDAEDADCDAARSTLPPIAHDGRRLAYTIFTSGSSGRPKGVQVEHASVVNYAHSVRELYGLSEDDRFLQFSSVSFDVAGGEIYPTLLRGAQLVLGSVTTEGPAEFQERVERQAVSVVNLPPAFWEQWVDWLCDEGREIPDRVRVLVLGGEAPSMATLGRWARIGGDRRAFFNAYGPTEATIDCLFYRWDWSRPEHLAWSKVPLGSPVRGSFRAVLDARRRLCPVGVPGELHIGGVSLARCYLDQPGLTAARFLDDPLGLGHRGRLYATGDRVRERADGTLEFLGRIDDQVKIRGFRVELPEVEAALVRTTPARKACVVHNPDLLGPGRAGLVAYVVAPAWNDGVDWRGALRGALPDHMIPAALVRVDAIPTSPTGKIDRKALPRPPSLGAARDGAPEEEEDTGLVRTVRAIWAEALGVAADAASTLDPHADFFALGGNSILAMRTLTRVNRTLGTRARLADLFAAPTVLGFCALLRERGARPHGAVEASAVKPAAKTAFTAKDPSAPAPADADASLVPLSHAQKRVWFLERLGEAGTAYVICDAIAFEGAFDVDAFARALAACAMRHDALRSVFEEGDTGEPRQRVLAHMSIPLARRSLADAGPDHADLRAILAEELRTPFDLARGPLVRCRVVATGPSETVLFLSMHHIVCDAWSMRVLVEDLARAYESARAGDVPFAHDPPAPHWREGQASLADRLARWEREGVVAKLAALLEGLPARLDLPFDRPRTLVPSSAGGRVRFSLDARTTSLAHATARRFGCTPFVVFAAAFQVLLARLSGQRDFALGTPMANRDDPETHGLVGMLVDTGVLRCSIAPGETFERRIARTRDAARTALSHQGVPFGRILETLALPRDPSVHPIFQVLFALHDESATRFSLRGANARVLELDASPDAKFDLALGIAIRGATCACEWEFRASLFSEESVARLTALYERTLHAACLWPERPVASLDILPFEQKAVIHAHARSGRSAFPIASDVAEAFRRQARSTPDAPAASDDSGTLSFAELQARACALADALRAADVRAQDRVVLLVERDRACFVGLLGILEAGAVVVPLDPATPPARVAAVFADCGARAAVVCASTVEGVRDLPAECTLLRLATDGAVVDRAGRSAHDGGTAVPNARRASAQPLPPDALAYVVYTSGSTGKPKGVAIPHAAVLAFAAAIAERVTAYRIRPQAHFAWVASVGFDASVQQWIALLLGHHVTIVPLALKADPARFLAFLDERGVDVFDGTPSYAELLLRAGLGREGGWSGTFLVGGEAISADLWNRMRAAGARVSFWNVYGPSECTVDATATRVDAHCAEPVLGAPLGNTQAYVVDDAFEPVPFGVEGELLLAGESLARCYFGRPDLTAAAFVPNPFGAPGTRAYRTGDRARLRADGTLVYVGRSDFQVKVKGYRVEPGEVEGALLGIEGVAEAAVVACPDAQSGGTRLVAFVTGACVDRSVDGLVDVLRERVPHYMVPSRIVGVACLPLSSSGKRDRRSLLALAREALESADMHGHRGDGEASDAAFGPGGDRTPLTTTEFALARIWAEALADPSGAPLAWTPRTLTRRADFFSIGGDSLSSVRVAALARREFGVELPLRRIFDARRLGDLARVVDEAVSARPSRPSESEAESEAGKGTRGDTSALDAAKAGDRAGTRRTLTSAQERLWLLERLGRGGDAYNIPILLVGRGALDTERFERALRHALREHPSLASAFPDSGDGTPLRVALDPESVRLERTPQGLDEARWDAFAAEFVQRRFDLAHGPLVRAAFCRTLDGDVHLCLVFHHIVFDGGSVVPFLASVRAAYETNGAAPSEPGATYEDFVHDENSFARESVFGAQLAWWESTLAGAPETSRIPSDVPLRTQGIPSGSVFRQPLESGLVRLFRAACRAHGLTEAMGLAYAFGWTLRAYAGQEEVVFGMPVDRRAERYRGTVGLFVNSVCVRVGAARGSTTSEALGAFRSRYLDAMANSDVPFDRIARVFGGARGSEANAPFQTMFTYQESGPLECVIGTTSFASAPVRVTGAAFDLTLGVRSLRDGLECEWEFDSGILSNELVGGFARAFSDALRALSSAAAHEAFPRTFLLTPERSRPVTESAPAQSAEAHARCGLRSALERVAARAPESVAVRQGESSWTYARLLDEAKTLAHVLQDEGVGPETRVAVCLPPEPRLVAALLGVLFAGGTYMPLDPGLPEERLAYVISDSDCAIVVRAGGTVVGGATGPTLPSTVSVVDLDTLAERVSRNPQSARSAVSSLPDVPAHALAYVIYTSGSTGRPKGVAIARASMLNYAETIASRCALMPGDVVSLFASVSFDFAVEEIFPTLLAGATIDVLPSSRVTPEELAAYAEAQGVSVLNLPTAFWHEWVADLAACPPPACLRMLTIGGEQPSREALADWTSLVGTRVRLANTYGPTETTVNATCHDFPPGFGPSADGRAIPIGLAFAGARVHLLDAHLEPVPDGAVGEIAIAGPGLARCYLGRPDLTAEKFVPHPCPRTPGERIYRTGDAGRLRPDGAIEFLGRLDDQVKHRGYRIELGEIDHALLSCPGVDRTAAALVTLENGARVLVGFVVPRDRSAGQAVVAEARARLATVLPAYMVPEQFEIVGAIPLSPTGKIDRKKLAALKVEPSSGRRDAAAVDVRHAAIAEIWNETIGAECASPELDFFEAGGNSLSAARFVSRVNRLLGTALPLRAIFDSPRFAAFADSALAHRDADADVDGGPSTRGAPSTTAATSSPAPVRRAPPHFRLEGYALTPAQTRFWFLSRLSENALALAIPENVRISGALDARILERAFSAVVERHEALRTAFRVREDGDPYQVVVERVPFTLARLDLSDRAPADALEAALARARDDGARAFDLECPPLLRATLVRLAPEDHVLLMTVHHIVCDGWSLSLLVHELFALHADLAAGRAPSLPEPTLQFADVALARAALEAASFESDVAYWKSALGGLAPFTGLPLDAPRPARGSQRAGSMALTLPAEDSEALREAISRARTTPYVFLLSALHALLHVSAQHSAIAVGSPAAERDSLETEGVVGLLVNTFVVASEWMKPHTFASLLADTKGRVQDAILHKSTPFERVVEALAPERNVAMNPIFQTLFTHDSLSGIPSDGAGAGMLGEFVDTPSASIFDLSVTTAWKSGRLRITFDYAADLFLEKTIELALERYVAIVRAACVRPETRIAADAFLLPRERHLQARVLEGARAFDHAPIPCFADLFARASALAPSAAAVVGDEGTLPYGELDALSDALAWDLAGRGIGPDSRVGLCAARGPLAIISMVAILKVGAAYVPLDPAYPSARIASIAARAGLSLVLTDLASADLAATFEDGAPRLVIERASSDRGKGRFVRARAVQPNAAAYVIFTSGSTGQPKGVVVTHENLARYAVTAAALQGLRPDDVCLHFASMNFDLSVEELYCPLVTGAALAIPPESVARDVPALARFLERHGVTVCFPSTAYWHALTEGLVAGSISLPTRLRHVAVIGERAQASRLVEWLSRTGPEGTVVNHYGPTEATVACTYHTVDREAWLRDDRPSELSIGEALPTATIHVLDDRMRRVPVGCPGELYIGGHAVTREYFGAPELTAERYLPDPFSPDLGARLFRTRDGARLRADGSVEFLGRLDDQVKLNGYRIEPGEIAAVARGAAGVADCFVALKDRPDGSRALVAYVKADAAFEGAQALRTHLADRLPRYMVPSAVVVIVALPLNPNGKVDVRALPAPQFGGGASTRVAPSGPTQEAIARIWTDVLAHEDFGVADSFFDAGGHSLNLLRLHGRLEKEFPGAFGMADLFRAFTIEAQAAVVSRAAGEGRGGGPLGGDVTPGGADPETELIDL